MHPAGARARHDSTTIAIRRASILFLSQEAAGKSRASRVRDAERPGHLRERMVRFLSMTLVAQRERPPGLLEEDMVFRDEQERAEWMAQEWLEAFPALEGVLIKKYAVEEARRILQIILDSRHLTPTAEEQARIDGCTDLAPLERWVKQAAVATSVAEALA